MTWYKGGDRDGGRCRNKPVNVVAEEAHSRQTLKVRKGKDGGIVISQDRRNCGFDSHLRFSKANQKEKGESMTTPIVIGGLYRKTQLIEVIDHAANEVIVCNENRLGDTWGMTVETFYSTYEPAITESGAENLKDVEFDFGVAVRLLKEGYKVARQGWNGKGMFLYYVPENSYPAQTDAAKESFGDMVPYGAYIAMKTAQGNVVPWLASQTDMLAEDWTVL